VKHIAVCTLEPEAAARLKRFAQAAMTFKSRIIRLAISEFIEKHLRENAGVCERFDRYTAEDEARAAAPKRAHLSVIK